MPKVVLILGEADGGAAEVKIAGCPGQTQDDRRAALAPFAEHLAQFVFLVFGQANKPLWR